MEYERNLYAKSHFPFCNEIGSIHGVSKKWLWAVVLLAAAIAGVAGVMVPRKSEKPPDSLVSSAAKNSVGVGARARIEPEGGVIVVAAPYLGGRPSLINELRVKEGDWVKAGQIIAILDGWPSAEKALMQNEADVEVARRKLDQVKAGSKQGDINAQKMDIARWESEYEIAANDHRRYENLRASDVVSPADLEQKRLIMDRNKRTLDAAKERLKSLEEIREVDVAVESAQLSAALAQVEHAKVDLERMVVRAPENGKVLVIHAHRGEEAAEQGILELGKTDHMYAVAEVHEADITRVRIGQKARISGDLIPDGLSGTVQQIGSEVMKSQLLPTDPAAYSDSRVVRVKIHLEDADRVAGLIYGKVDAVIEP